LEAIKIMIAKRENALVVLATGGGKSLIYQFVSQFMPGLILVVSPLIALMQDQLLKLPAFMPGALINSQLTYIQKRSVIEAV
jgi:ATP-dependent DNA helicase Q4